MDSEFTQKMRDIYGNTLNDISDYFEDKAVEAHVFGSIAKGTNDALSDVDIWITFEDSNIQEVIENRFDTYSKFGNIVLLHELQNNFPLNGIQSAVIYDIDDELIRVDYYLCPFSSSRVIQGSKILFEHKTVEIGEIIPETKRTPRNISDRITFLINMCFNAIKKIVRNDKKFIDFLVGEFQKYEKDIPAFSDIPREYTFETIKKMLTILNTVSNQEQKNSIAKINSFLLRVELSLE